MRPREQQPVTPSRALPGPTRDGTPSTSSSSLSPWAKEFGRSFHTRAWFAKDNVDRLLIFLGKFASMKNSVPHARVEGRMSRRTNCSSLSEQMTSKQSPVCRSVQRTLTASQQHPARGHSPSQSVSGSTPGTGHYRTEPPGRGYTGKPDLAL